MRFSAIITTEEELAEYQSVSSLNENGSSKSNETFRKTSTTTGYETDSVEHTIHIQPSSGSQVSSSLSKNKHLESEKGKLNFPSVGMLLFRGNRNEQKSIFDNAEKEFKTKHDANPQIKSRSITKKKQLSDNWKTMMSSKNPIKHPNDEFEASSNNDIEKGKVLLSDTVANAQQQRKSTEVSRIIIGENEYFLSLKQEKVITALEDLALKSGNYMIPFLLTYCQKIKEICENDFKTF